MDKTMRQDWHVDPCSPEIVRDDEGRKVAECRTSAVAEFLEVCAACGAPAQGNYSIHRDGFCDGPEVPLCNGCGSEETPTLPQIWAAIARRRKAHAEGRFCGFLMCTDDRCIEAECAAMPMGGWYAAKETG
jgi:hypothetical protein